MSKIAKTGGAVVVAAACLVAVHFLSALYRSPQVETWHVYVGFALTSAAFLSETVGLIAGADFLRKAALVGSLAAAATALGYVAAIEYGWIKYFEDTDSLLELIRRYDSYAVLIFVAVQFAQVTILPLPATLTTIAGFTVFGVGETLLYSSAAIIAGSMVAFAAGRTFGVRLAVWLCGAKSVAKYRELLKGRETLLLYAMFLLPIFPDDLLCVIAGLGSMSYRSFGVMMLITRPVGVLWTAAVYKGAVNIPANAAGIAAWVAIALVTVAVFAVLYKYGEKISEKLANVAAIVQSKLPHKPTKPRNGVLRDDQIAESISAVDASFKSLIVDVTAKQKPPEGGDV